MGLYRLAAAATFYCSALYGANSLPAVVNASLTGKYFFRQLQFSTDTSGNLTDTRAALGTIQFDGNGNYSLSGSFTEGVGAALSLNVTGTYSVNSPGTMTMTDPLRNSLFMNGRLGAEALMASTTESADNTFDLLIAIPAPTSTASFSGSFYCSTLEFPGGGSSVRSALFTLPVSSSQTFGSINVLGHASSVSSGALTSQTLNGATFALQSDGTGSASFGAASNNLSGTKNFYVSASGSMILGGSLVAGTQDFMACVKQFNGTPTTSTWSGLYWTGGLRFDTDIGRNSSTSAYAGSLNAMPSLTNITMSQRLHQLGISPGFDFTGSNSYSVNSDLTFASNFDIVGMGLSGALFAAVDLNQYDTTGYSFEIGVLAPTLSGTGVYINPQGIMNAASLAPAGVSIAPGEYLSIFGTGLGGSDTSGTPPYPTTLNGTSVSVNGIAAPVSFASATQLNILVPYGVTGSSATIQATYNEAKSNQVIVPLAAAAPGVFSSDGSGTGLGAVRHSDGTAVNSSNPAKRGETIVVYLTGLGAVATSVADGAAATGQDSANVKTAVYIGETTGTIVYAGLAPGFPGLYQINVTVPTAATGTLPLAVQNPYFYADHVSIPVQ